MLLFVAANWDRIAPGGRFGLVMALLAVFHIAGAVSSRDSRVFQSTLHAIGTAILGAAIALTGRIFQLPEDWPAGTFLWATDSVVAWRLLRDTAQLVLSAMLFPLWMASAFHAQWPTDRVALWGATLLLALVYLGACQRDQTDTPRQALLWIGGILLFPSAIAATAVQHEPLVIGQCALAMLPVIALAIIIRRGEIAVVGAFAFWILAFDMVARNWSFFSYVWGAIGSGGLIAWGWRNASRERINLGVGGFAFSILSFYVSNVFDRLGRSASLITLGVLLIAGGWGIERTRRHLVSQL